MEKGEEGKRDLATDGEIGEGLERRARRCRRPTQIKIKTKINEMQTSEKSEKSNTQC